MKRLFVPLIAFALASSISVWAEDPKPEPTRHSKIYYFQHRLLPNWVHHSDGRFFADLKSGIPQKMISEAEEIVDEEFAKALQVKPYPAKKAYAITFLPPEESPECFYVIVKKDDDGYSYYTLEKGMDLFNEGALNFLCEWTESGSHSNRGPREYDDLDSFAEEILFPESEE